jgi:hypothetical protein
MDRRWWGTAVVVLALLAAFVVPNLAGHRIDGSATRVPIPEPPRVGQCLLADIDGERSALNYAQVVVAAAPIGPCADTNYGEVVSVTADRHEFPSTVVNRMRHPEPLACQPIARRYLGWDDPSTAVTDVQPPPVPGATGDPGRTLGLWRPVSTVYVGLLGPDIWQYLTGQGWIACVLYPRTGEYSGTVRGGLAGPAAAAFGSCQDGLEPTAQQRVSCSGAHSVETFATSDAADADPNALAASCRELVATATGMADPTVGGALSVAVVVGGSFGVSPLPAIPEPGAPVVTDPMDAESGQAACIVSVVGDRQLIGSLTGWGDSPLPWAP